MLRLNVNRLLPVLGVHRDHEVLKVVEHRGVPRHVSIVHITAFLESVHLKVVLDELAHSLLLSDDVVHLSRYLV